MKYFSILRPMKYDVRFEYVPWKIVWFCCIFIVWVHFSNKTEKFRFWKSLKYFHISWLEKIWGQIWLCLMEKCLILFRFHWLDSCSHITEEFRFWKSLKYLNIFLDKKKYRVRFEYVPRKNIWFCFIFIVWTHLSHKSAEFWLWKPLKYFQLRNSIGWQIKICPPFFVLFIFLALL